MRLGKTASEDAGGDAHHVPPRKQPCFSKQKIQTGTETKIARHDSSGVMAQPSNSRDKTWF